MLKTKLIGGYFKMDLVNKFNDLASRTQISKTKLLEDAIIRYIEYRGAKDFKQNSE